MSQAGTNIEILEQIRDLRRDFEAFRRRLEIPVISGGGTGAPSPHALTSAHHTGVSAGPDIDLTPTGIGRGGDTILIFDSGGNPLAEFAATSAGLDLATAAATAGDKIELPARTISGAHVLGAGVHYAGLGPATVLTGQITGGSDGSLQNVAIARAASDANTLKGLVCPAGAFTVRACDITCIQSGVGDCHGVENLTDFDTEVRSCWVDATSVSGLGYAFYSVGAGLIDVYGGKAHGSTAKDNQ